MQRTDGNGNDILCVYLVRVARHPRNTSVLPMLNGMSMLSCGELCAMLDAPPTGVCALLGERGGSWGGMSRLSVL